MFSSKLGILVCYIVVLHFTWCILPSFVPFHGSQHEIVEPLSCVKLLFIECANSALKIDINSI